MKYARNKKPTIWTKCGANGMTTSTRTNATHNRETILAKQQDGKVGENHLLQRILTLFRTTSTKARETEVEKPEVKKERKINFCLTACGLFRAPKVPTGERGKVFSRYKRLSLIEQNRKARLVGSRHQALKVPKVDTDITQSAQSGHRHQSGHRRRARRQEKTRDPTPLLLTPQSATTRQLPIAPSSFNPRLPLHVLHSRGQTSEFCSEREVVFGNQGVASTKRTTTSQTYPI